jgi:hypothetical protein
MFRCVPAWLSFLALGTISFITGANARDLPPNWTESPPLLPNSDVSYWGTALSQYSPRDPAENQVVGGAQISADADSIAAARAQYVPPPPKAMERPVFIPPQHVAIGSSFDADSIGNRNVYVDATLAPFSGIYESGMRLRVMGDASWYKFVTNEEPRTLGAGHYLESAVLVGYGMWVPGFNITWLVGPAFAESVNEGVVTDRWGVRAGIDMNAKTALTMASGSVSYSSMFNTLQAQAKAGLKIFGDVYLGPEAKFKWQQLLPWQINFFSGSLATTTPVSPQNQVATLRVGAHVSAVRLGPAFIGVSGGWTHDRRLGSGYYGSVDLYQPF